MGLSKLLKSSKRSKTMKYRLFLVQKLKEMGLPWRTISREYDNINANIKKMRESIKKVKYNQEDKFMCIICEKMYNDYFDALYHVYESHFCKINLRARQK